MHNPCKQLYIKLKLFKWFHQHFRKNCILLQLTIQRFQIIGRWNISPNVTVTFHLPCLIETEMFHYKILIKCDIGTATICWWEQEKKLV